MRNLNNFKNKLVPHTGEGREKEVSEQIEAVIFMMMHYYRFRLLYNEIYGIRGGPPFSPAKRSENYTERKRIKAIVKTILQNKFNVNPEDKKIKELFARIQPSGIGILIKIAIMSCFNPSGGESVILRFLCNLLSSKSWEEVISQFSSDEQVIICQFKEEHRTFFEEVSSFKEKNCSWDNETDDETNDVHLNRNYKH